MIIKILGTGCPKCQQLEHNTKEAVKLKNIEAEVVKVTDIKEIMAYGVMSTPAIVIDEVVKAYGQVVPIPTIMTWLS
jgi:small redox-active disulfide protein 2